MDKRKIHIHSMLVHVVAALSPLAAIAYILFTRQVSILSFGPATWSFIVYFSLITVFLTSLLSILSGVFERNHVYANWLLTHKIKLILSLLLVTGLIVELSLLWQTGLEGGLVSLQGGLIVVGNTVIVFLLGAYGLKITLGRQSFGKASYTPDLFRKEPVDILVEAGQHRKEEAKYLDLLTER